MTTDELRKLANEIAENYDSETSNMETELLKFGAIVARECHDLTLQQRCERATAWDQACLAIAQKHKEMAEALEREEK